MLRTAAPIPNLHPAKPPFNLWGELLQAFAGLVFMYVIFGGGFAFAAWLCANF
jgi:hypothetical protein